jgi:membrane protein
LNEKEDMKELQDLLDSIYREANRLTGGALGILGDAYNRFNKANAGHVAAALAYFAMFSLFPLLLALIAAGSFFLEGEQVQQRVVQSLMRVVPISAELIRSNVDQVLERRGTIGVVGLVGLIWSGTGVFTVLLDHINRAWAKAEQRSFVEKRLLGLGIGILGIVAALLMLSFLTTPVLNVLPRLEIRLDGRVPIFDRPLWTLIASGLPVVLTFLTFLALYRWGPNTDVRWSEAAWPALFVALAWEVAKRVFAWYVSSDLVRYRLVYGSLGAVVALLLWIYVSSMLVLFGAHLSAAIARNYR